MGHKMENNWISEIDKTWSLFLDRDGVINLEKEGDYIRNLSEFQFIENSKGAIARLSSRFGRVFIVTNQKGIGRGLMSAYDLEIIHNFLMREVENAGGSIDQIYFCSEIEADAPCRKPNPGMALQAKMDYPDIEFSKSVMIGNTLSDMRFGKSCDMRTIFILSNKTMPEIPHPDIDLVHPSLFHFANSL